LAKKTYAQGGERHCTGMKDILLWSSSPFVFHAKKRFAATSRDKHLKRFWFICNRNKVRHCEAFVAVAIQYVFLDGFVLGPQ
jgi:hypothetical protein